MRGCAESSGRAHPRGARYHRSPEFCNPPIPLPSAPPRADRGCWRGGESVLPDRRPALLPPPRRSPLVPRSPSAAWRNPPPAASHPGGCPFGMWVSDGRRAHGPPRYSLESLFSVVRGPGVHGHSTPRDAGIHPRPRLRPEVVGDSAQSCVVGGYRGRWLPLVLYRLTLYSFYSGTYPPHFVYPSQLRRSQLSLTLLGHNLKHNYPSREFTGEEELCGCDLWLPTLRLYLTKRGQFVLIKRLLRGDRHQKWQLPPKPQDTKQH